MSEPFNDWRGQPLTPGDIVFYPSMRSRSCQITEGILLDIYRVYYHPDTYEWTKLEPEQEIPTRPVWRDGEVVGKEECSTEWRALIQPTGDSRFPRSSTRGTWNHETGERGPEQAARPITLSIVQNLTWFCTP